MGALLVGLQFTLLLLLTALATPAVLRGLVPLGASVLAGAAVLLVTWTLVHNRVGNFNIRPHPRAGALLVTSGPYRWIRHPMYTAVLLGAAGLAWICATAAGWGAWSALVVVLLLKSQLEERWMRGTHAHYAAYAAGSKRFVPGIF